MDFEDSVTADYIRKKSGDRTQTQLRNDPEKLPSIREMESLPSKPRHFQ